MENKSSIKVALIVILGFVGILGCSIGRRIVRVPTPTLTPTMTPRATYTPTSTGTSTPSPTVTPEPSPTAVVTPSDSPVPPTDTPLPPKPVPPTDTPKPVGMDTPVPPADTSKPAGMDTPQPPSATPTPLHQFSGELIWDPAYAANCGTAEIGKRSKILGLNGEPLNRVRVKLWAEGWEGVLCDPSGPPANPEPGSYNCFVNSYPVNGTWFVAVQDVDGLPVDSEIIAVTFDTENCEPGGDGHQVAIVNWRQNW